MSLLERARPTTAARTPRTPAYLPGALAAGRAAGLSLAAIGVPVLLLWATAAHVTASWSQALRLAVSGWLLVQHVGIDFPGGRVGLTPLALSAVPAFVLYRTGRRLARHPVVAPPAGTGSAQQPGSAGPVWEALAGLAVGYALVATLLALLAHSAAVSPVIWQAPLGPGLLALLAGGAGLLRAHPVTAPGASGPGLVVNAYERVPTLVRVAAHAAGRAIAGLAALGALTVLISLAVHLDRVVTLHRALDPGAGGGLILVLGQLGYLPVVAGWGLAWLSGAGFAVGSGTTFAPATVHAAVLPVIPALGALPDRALPSPAWVVAAMALPALAGVLAGVRVARPAGAPAADEDAEPPAGELVDAPLTAFDTLLTAALAAVFAAAAALVLLVLSAGPIGPGRLADVGPSVLRAGVLLLAELLAGALAGSAVMLGWRAWRGRSRTATARPATD